MRDKINEECAVFGVNISSDDAGETTYNALLTLQHRGQEGAGIAVLSDNKIFSYKDTGLVSEVFSNEKLSKLPKSNFAIGHCRYSTTGTVTQENTQPFVIEYLTGRIATVHNGNIINASEIRDELKTKGVNFASTSDSEVVSNLIAYETVTCKDVIKGITNASKQLRGSFSLCILTSDGQLIAVRDPWGFRPLSIGENHLGMAVASESCALDGLNFKTLRDVEPGEIIVIKEGKITNNLIYKTEKTGLCIFEYVYFARTDSIIDGLSVYDARFRMGRILAQEHPIKADIVCGVPDSGIEAAMGYSFQSGIPYSTAFVKNRYIGRSFICPTQAQRESAVKLKLNPLRTNVEGKSIILIDDSIVRGTTCAKIVSCLKEAGATYVHMLISSPPFKHSCHFGTDIDNEENLIANNFTTDEVCKKIGADSLGYISIKGLEHACSGCNINLCKGCFTGEYPIKVGNISKYLFE